MKIIKISIWTCLLVLSNTLLANNQPGYSTSSIDSQQNSHFKEVTVGSAIYDSSIELAGFFAASTYLGIQTWDWGTSNFNVKNEGWFEVDTYAGGADKFGHLYSTYLLSNIYSSAMLDEQYKAEDAAFYGALFGWMSMFYIEWIDGYSKENGFSNNDVIANTLGSGMTYLRTVYPSLASKLDLRVEYLPSRAMEGFHPIVDYTGYKYLMAVKGAGFQSLNQSPLKYFELHLGYYTRGYKKRDQRYFDEKVAAGYVGIGINLSELLFDQKPKNIFTKGSKTFLEYYQIPKTYVESVTWQRTAPFSSETTLQ